MTFNNMDAGILGDKLDRIEEKLEIIFPELKGKKSEAWNLAVSRMEDVGCGELPTSETYTDEQRITLTSYAKENLIFAIHLSLIIGFANGVEWARNDADKLGTENPYNALESINSSLKHIEQSLSRKSQASAIADGVFAALKGDKI